MYFKIVLEVREETKEKEKSEIYVEEIDERTERQKK